MSTYYGMPPREWRAALHESVLGRCFYCWAHIALEDEKLPRDWLRVRGGNRMVTDHTHPSARGGENNPGNMVPACAACNREKSDLTLDEYQFVKGLERHDLAFRFPLIKHATPRDWLYCYSEGFERPLLHANYPASKWRRRGA